jgi:hydroxymethylglutaryl-CoA lyase
MTPTVEVVEVGPRDGLQNEAKALPVDSRVELINRLVAQGVRRMEAVSFVHPDRVPQMAGAEEVMRQVPPDAGVTYIGLVLNRRGAERAADTACSEINVVVPVTDEFSQRNQNATVDQLVAEAGAATKIARQAGMTVSVTLAVAFGCPFAGPVSTREVRQVYEQVADLGVDEIAFADTIGVGVPQQVTELAELARGDARVSRLRYHFHNTRNTGYANAFAAASLHGFEEVALDASLGGFGGCPFAPAATGNIATEDLAYLLRRQGLPGARFDIPALADVAHWLAGELENPVPGLLARAGDFGAEAS